MSSINKTRALLGSLIFALVCYSLAVRPSAPASAQQAAPQDASPAPVEPDMHEFMEYFFQPTYRELKAAMAAEPQNNGDWLKLKAGSLVLSEGGNLVLLRGPEDERDDWSAHAVGVREAGAKMYRAAQARDFQAASANYRAMLGQCNACHQQFAGGEHQLTP